MDGVRVGLRAGYRGVRRLAESASCEYSTMVGSE